MALLPGMAVWFSAAWSADRQNALPNAGVVISALSLCLENILVINFFQGMNSVGVWLLVSLRVTLITNQLNGLCCKVPTQCNET